MNYKGDYKEEGYQEETSQDAKNNFSEAEGLTENGGSETSEKTTDGVQDVGCGERNSEGGSGNTRISDDPSSKEQYKTKLSDLPTVMSKTKIYGSSSSYGNKYRNLISPSSMKPLVGITVKKPKLDLPRAKIRSYEEVRKESSRLSCTTISLSSMTESTQNATNTSISTNKTESIESSVGLSDGECDVSESERFNFRATSNEINFQEDNRSGKGPDSEVGEDATENQNEQNNNNVVINNDSLTKRGIHQSIGDSIITNPGDIHTCSANKSKLLDGPADLIPIKQQLPESKLNSLSKIFQESPEYVDIKLSLFMAACAHDPKELRPYPQKIFEDNEANRNLIYYIAEEIPSVNILSFYLKNKRNKLLRKDLLPLVDWLIRSEEPRLELLKEEQYKNIIDSIGETDKQYYPSKMFRIKIKRNSEQDESWINIKGDYDTHLAYHGGQVHRAHDLLNHVLHNQLNENGSLGSGIYLTNDLNACLNASPSARTWGKSSIATKVQLIYITEFVSNHNVKTYGGEGMPFNVTQENKYKYYFIMKPKLVRLKYLLVYVNEASVIPIKLVPRVNSRKNVLKYLKILRVVLLVATLFVGLAAAKRSVIKSTSLIKSMQNFYSRISEEMQNWNIWQYVETPCIVIPL